MSRMDKINQMIRKEIGMMIQMGEVSDPRLNFVTITRVDASKDLHHAKVWFSVLSQAPKDIEQAQNGLNSARPYLRKLLGQRVEIRYIPELEFHYDRSLNESLMMDETLENLKQEREQRAADPDSQ